MIEFKKGQKVTELSGRYSYIIRGARYENGKLFYDIQVISRHASPIYRNIPASAFLADELDPNDLLKEIL